MKFAVVFVALFSCALASIVPLDVSEETETIDWSVITPKNIYVEPKNPAPEFTGPRIIGGTEVTRNSFPYQVAIIINSGGFCGSSLISTNWVLTAAHCVDTARTVQAIFGAHNVNNAEATQVTRQVSGLSIHSGWVSSTLQNDIALLRLASAISLSNVIQTISLAPASSGTFAGSTAVLTGWGRTSDSSNAISPVLRQVTLSIITNAVCQSSYGSTIQANHICTSGVGNIGACNGDSGGPLVVNGVQVGVVSFGSSRCQAGNPTAFARVSHFRSWISSISGL